MIAGFNRMIDLWWGVLSRIAGVAQVPKILNDGSVAVDKGVKPPGSRRRPKEKGKHCHCSNEELVGTRLFLRLER